MRLFLKEEIRKLEAGAVERGISMEALMENAGRALAEEALLRVRPMTEKKVAILCGKGNNGGDGFVCARVLSGAGARCTVILTDGNPTTALARSALEALPQDVLVLDAAVEADEAETALETADILFDCVFGFGFRGDLPAEIGVWLELASGQEALKIAADLPSGAECDTGRLSENSFKADVTVAFTGAKPAHVSYPAKEFCGEVVVRQVGVPEELKETLSPRFFETDPCIAAAPLNAPDVQANKGDLGHLLLVCGSEGMAGACIMAARAALRSGVGLTRVVIPRELYPVLAPVLPECIFTVVDWDDSEAAEETLCSALEWATACLIGCGLGALAEKACPVVFEQCRVPLIIDADALNFAAWQPESLALVQAPMVLTPHPGEMARLCDDEVGEIQADRLGAAREKARETGAVVVLKGAATVIAGAEGKCAVNPTGNPGMAKGGSGDVLAGIIASLAAQGVSSFDAAVTGVYVHGLAGDRTAEKLTQRAMLSTDLIESLSEAWQLLKA